MEKAAERGRQTVHLTPWVYIPSSDTYEDYVNPKHATWRRDRNKLFFDAYGTECPSDFMETVYRRIKICVCDKLSRDAAAGDKNAIRMIKDGFLAHYTKVAGFIKECGQDWA